jgi:hypothetical protein
MAISTTLRNLVFGAFAGLAVGTSCDLGGTAVPGGLPKVPGACPDLTSLDAIAKVDFAAEFGVDAKLGAQIKGGIEAAAQLQGFAAQLDADLAGACGGLATDLGKPGEYKEAKVACKAALDAMAEIKGKIGGSAKISVSIEPPRCSASLDAMAECVGKCDASVDPGSLEVKCEPGKLSGTCEAECSGTCSLDAAAKCDGTCKGSCDAKFSGTCGGECNGKCNGKTSKGGVCNGKCEGKCSASAEGTCGGSCSGSCELKAAAKCGGTCTGECSVAMQAPKCEGKVEPPKASAECNAKCEADISAKLECTPAKVAVNITGGADAAAVAQYKAALEKNLPGVLKIAIGMKDQALSVAGNVKSVVEGATSVVGKLKSDPKIGARLTACVVKPFKAAIDAAVGLQASIDVSVEVKASASASAGGSASGSAG